MGELNFIVLTGRFAAGKDTQAGRLVKRLGEESTEIISTGDIYRSAKSGTGEYSRFHHLIVPHIEDIDSGRKLLPDSVMIQIVQEVILEKVRGGKENFIFNGFPRTIPQLEYFDQMIANFREVSKTDSIFIEYAITDEVSRVRSTTRRDLAEKNGKTLRPEDSDDGIANRIAMYHRDIEPLIEKLREEGRLITINAEGFIPDIEAETSKIIFKERG